MQDRAYENRLLTKIITSSSLHFNNRKNETEKNNTDDGFVDEKINELGIDIDDVSDTECSDPEDNDPLRDRRSRHSTMVALAGILSRLVYSDKEKSAAFLSLLNELITRARTNLPLNVNFPTQLLADASLRRLLSPAREALRNAPNSLNAN